jgi:iron complex outermembrane receptor protein
VKGSYNALCSYPITGVEPPNPHLKAVTSTNATFGVIFEPIREFNVSLDWYHIQLKNDIINVSETGSLANYVSIARGPSVSLPVCINTPASGNCATANVLTPVGYPEYLNFPYVNAAVTTTSGIDMDLRGHFDLDVIGKFTAEFNYTYVTEYDLKAGGANFELAGTHGPSSISGDTGNPRQRAVASLTWEKGPGTVTLSANYTGAFSITDPTEGWNSCLVAIQTSGVGYGAAIPATVTSLPPAFNQYCTVHHFTDFNLYGSYAVTDHFAVHASIRNLFDTQPPVDLQTYGGGALFRYSTLDQDGAVGRFFLVGASLRF